MRLAQRPYSQQIGYSNILALFFSSLCFRLANLRMIVVTNGSHQMRWCA